MTRPSWLAFDLPEVASDARASGSPWHEFIRVPDLYVGVYRLAPGEEDRQSPHDADEVYHVVSGEADFVVGDERVAVGPGSVLYVEKDTEHRFMDVREELTILVFFATPD